MTTQTIANQQEKFIIKIDKHIERMVDSVTRKKLTDAYMKLFTGFAWVNWTKKQSLGRAWQNALGQCEGFLKSKNKTNPAIKYLNIVAKSHKTYWSRVIMTNPNSPNTINKTPTEIKQMQQYGEKLIRESMDTINLIIARYNEYIEEITGAEKTSVRTAENKPQNQTAQIPQVKPLPQAQQAPQQIAQPQVATMEKQMPQVKPLAQVQQAPQQIAQPQVATIEKQMPQVKPLPQVQQAPQQIAQPQVATMEKQMPQAKPLVQAQQAPQQIAQPQVATMEKPMPQIKPLPQAQQAPQQIAQPQVATMEKQMPQVKPLPQAQQAPQQIAQPQVATIKKQIPQVKPLPQAQQAPQQIAKLNPVANKQIVQQRINLFIMAKYNQKTA